MKLFFSIIRHPDNVDKSKIRLSGPEEEKLLGSILLPSYRVTVCKPEDKVNKKFAFKAEHANMRTYHFAADSRESMNQWVNALTLATLLQDPSPWVYVHDNTFSSLFVIRLRIFKFLWTWLNENEAWKLLLRCKCPLELLWSFLQRFAVYLNLDWETL